MRGPRKPHPSRPGSSRSEEPLLGPVGHAPTFAKDWREIGAAPPRGTAGRRRKTTLFPAPLQGRQDARLEPNLIRACGNLEVGRPRLEQQMAGTEAGVRVTGECTDCQWPARLGSSGAGHRQDFWGEPAGPGTLFQLTLRVALGSTAESPDVRNGLKSGLPKPTHFKPSRCCRGFSGVPTPADGRPPPRNTQLPEQDVNGRSDIHYFAPDCAHENVQATPVLNSGVRQSGLSCPDTCTGSAVAHQKIRMTRL